MQRVRVNSSAIKSIGMKAAAIELELRSESAVRRMACLKSIGEGFSPRISKLVESRLCATLARDKNVVVAHEAAFLLANLFERGLISGDLAMQALCEAANSYSVLIRHEVALSLSAFPGMQTISLLRRLARDPVSDVALSAQLALEEITPV